MVSKFAWIHCLLAWGEINRGLGPYSTFLIEVERVVFYCNFYLLGTFKKNLITIYFDLQWKDRDAPIPKKVKVLYGAGCARAIQKNQQIMFGDKLKNTLDRVLFFVSQVAQVASLNGVA